MDSFRQTFRSATRPRGDSRNHATRSTVVASSLLLRQYDILDAVLTDSTSFPRLPHRDSVHPALCTARLRGRGVGWVARRPIAAGQLALSCKPVALVSDKEVDGEHAENADTALLIIEIAQQLVKRGPKLWQSRLAGLYPRPRDMAQVKTWVCDDADLGAKVEVAVNSVAFLSASNKNRLKLIVRYNSLSVETNGEQLCHGHQFGATSGLALYPEASLFNHSCTPNVTRFCVGDVMYFRTNRPILCGEELCISYIESHLLSEPAAVRNEILGSRDFQLSDRPANEGEGPILGPEIVDELEATPPMDRLATLQELRGDSSYAERLRPCDRKELDVQQAVTLMQLGKPGAALPFWERTIEFCVDCCPPNDESLVCFATQAAVCALEAHDVDRAGGYLSLALATHAIAFGPGLPLFLARYRAELDALPGGISREPLMDLLQQMEVDRH